jgi:hypothetical protein
VAGRDRPALSAVDVDTHRALARELNRAVWDGLASDRDPVADAGLADVAHASLHHWRVAGGPVEEARGEWLVSHVYAVLGRAEPALHHARRSYELCVAHGFGDFDLAYGYEGMARAHAVAGDLDEARTWHARATAAGAEVADEEDRTIFADDLAAGPWYGL